MTSILEDELKNNKNTACFPLHECWLDIGRVEDFQKAQLDINRLI